MTFLSRKFRITRLSIAFEDFLGSSIASQVMPPCNHVQSCIHVCVNCTIMYSHVIMPQRQCSCIRGCLIAIWVRVSPPTYHHFHHQAEYAKEFESIELRIPSYFVAHSVKSLSLKCQVLKRVENQGKVRPGVSLRSITTFTIKQGMQKSSRASC